MTQDREARRLKALEAYRVLDTAPEPSFDRLTALAADLFKTPMALVSLVDRDRQWFKSRRGLAAPSTPRAVAFCAHAIEMDPNAVMVVPDATADPRFRDSPLVLGAPDLRFYAGAVLTSRDGFNLGTLCVLDTVARARPSDADLARLSALAEVVVDELELRRALRADQEKTRLLELAEIMSGVGHWRYDLGPARLTWSDEVYRIHGVSRDTFEPTLRCVFDSYEGPSRSSLAALVADSLANKSGHEIKLQVRRPSGEVRDIACKTACELNDQAEVSALYGVIRDITDEVGALRDLAQQKSGYKLLADNAADVIARVRLDGAAIYVSPSVEALFGYPPGEVKDRLIQTFVSECDHTIMMDALAEMAAGREDMTIQCRANHRDGRTIWVELHLKLLRDGAGQPAEIVAVARNIQAGKALEAELREARARAETAAAVKGEFLANMSHELRTPLTAVLGFSKLALEQTELSEETRSMLDRAVYAGEALLSTVNDVLDFSKLEAGQITIRPVSMAPADMVRRTLGIFELAAYSEGRLRFSVTDTGPGIASDMIDGLFRRFSQVDGSSTRRHGGTGLGLAISKGLVDAMGGRIGVDSELGRGSCFWCDLPAPEADSAIASPAEDAMLPYGTRLLLVDDNPINRELVKALLSPFDIEVDEAADGLAAVIRAQQAPYDIILMDLRMPRLDGAGAALRIRKEAGPNRDIPIVAFSAHAEAGAADPVFDGWIDKPVSAAALLNTLSGLLAVDSNGASAHAA